MNKNKDGEYIDPIEKSQAHEICEALKAQGFEANFDFLIPENRDEIIFYNENCKNAYLGLEL